MAKNTDMVATLKVKTDQWEEGLKKSGKSMDDFKGKVEGNSLSLKAGISMLAKYAGGLASVGTAMKVVTDALKRTTAFDEWEIAVRQSEVAYSTFLDTLNNGRWDKFMSNLDDAISGARDLWNQLNDFNDMKISNAIAVANIDAEIMKLNNQKNLTADAKKIQEINQQIKALGAQRHSLQMETAKKGEDVGITEAREELRRNLKTSGVYVSDYEVSRLINELLKGETAGFTKYANIKDELYAKGLRKQSVTTGSMFVPVTTTTHEIFDKNKLSGAERRLYLIAKSIDDMKPFLQEHLQLYVQAKKDAEEAERDYFQSLRIANRKSMMAGKGGGKGGGAASWMGGAIADRTLGMGVGSISTLEIDAIQPTQAAMEHFSQWVKDNPPAPLEVPVVVDPLEELKGTADGIAEAFGAASGALSQFASESKAAAVAAKSFTIAGSIATLVGQFASIPKGKEIWSWIAGTIAGTGTLVATIASIKNASRGYSEGGEIKGAHSTGDMIPIMANAGEIVLSTGMQRNVAAALTSRQGGTVDLALRGDQIVGCINNYGRGHGLGKIVFQ